MIFYLYNGNAEGAKVIKKVYEQPNCKIVWIMQNSIVVTSSQEESGEEEYGKVF